MAQSQAVAPPFGDAPITALIDAAQGLATREGRWRRALAAQVAPRPGEMILEIGCGAGALAIALAQAAPRAEILAVDWDEALLARARERARDAGVRIEFAHALDRGRQRAIAAAPNRVVASFVNRPTGALQKRALIESAHAALRADGTLHLADYGPQRTPLMRRLREAARAGKSVDEIATPSALLIAEMRNFGFVAVEETESFPTPTGSVSLYRARLS